MSDPTDGARDPADRDVRGSDAPSAPSKAVKGGRSVLAAVMIGLGQVLEPEKFDEDMHIEAPADDDPDDPLKGIGFGNLPPLS